MRLACGRVCVRDRSSRRTHGEICCLKTTRKLKVTLTIWPFWAYESITYYIVGRYSKQESAGSTLCHNTMSLAALFWQKLLKSLKLGIFHRGIAAIMSFASVWQIWKKKAADVNSRFAIQRISFKWIWITFRTWWAFIGGLNLHM